MQNFQEFSIENMGGNDSFNFIPSVYVSKFPDIYNNLISDPVEPKSGKAFCIGLVAPKTLQFDEEQKETAAGNLYITKITGKYPGQSHFMHNLFGQMASMYHILDIKDNNGNRRLVGSLKNPARFSFAFSTKDTPGARPEYTFQFTWQNTQPAPFYNI